MYIKLCQRYKGGGESEGGAKLPSDPKLCVAVEGGGGDGKQTPAAGNIRVYQGVSAVLAGLCALLLLLTVALAVKLQNGSAVCPVTEEAGSCSTDQCRSVCDAIQPPTVGESQVSRRGHACYQCPPRWLKFQDKCFFLSTTRLNWELSQNTCRTSGGSLAVIDSKEVQDFLTQKGALSYWIGLKHNGTWNWVDSTVLRENYWADNPQAQGCAMLRSEEPAGKNWKSGLCATYLYFICQLQM